MHMNCTICSDLFVPADIIYATPCGHVFHHSCLVQWVERSKSCPQCRAKTTENKISRIFFNTVNIDGQSDPSCLQNKIDSLKFQLHMKTVDSQKVTEQNEELKKQNQGLIHEVKSAESKVSEYKNMEIAFKEKIKFLTQECKQVEDARKDARLLRQKLETFKNLEIILNGGQKEVDNILSSFSGSSGDQRSLAMYVSMLKRELSSSTEKRRVLKDQFGRLRMEISSLKVENNKLKTSIESKDSAISRLQSDNNSLVSENKSFQKKVRELEAAISSPTPSSSSSLKSNVIKRILYESPHPEEFKIPKLSNPENDEEEVPAIKSQTESPYLSVKKSIFGLSPLMRQSSAPVLPSSKNLSIFSVSRHSTYSSSLSKFNQNRYGEGYDGMGGHSKHDSFPEKINKVEKKIVKTDVRKRIPLKPMSRKIDEFFYRMIKHPKEVGLNIRLIF